MKRKSKKAFKCNHETDNDGEVCNDCFGLIVSDVSDTIWGATKELLDKYEKANVSAQIIMNSLLREGSFVGSLMDMSVGEFVHEAADVFGETMEFLQEGEEISEEEEPSKVKPSPAKEETKADNVVVPIKSAPDKNLN